MVARNSNVVHVKSETLAPHAQVKVAIPLREKRVVRVESVDVKAALARFS